MQVVVRREAKALGCVRYYNGKPCPQGHIAERFVESGKCVECNRQSYDPEYQKSYYQLRRKAKIKYAKDAYRKDPAKTVKRAIEWKKNNRDKVLDGARRYRERYPDECNRRIADWESRNPDMRAEFASRRRARLLSAVSEVPVSREDLAALRKRREDKCPYCSIKLNGKGHLDHITPLARGGLHELGNLQWTCGRCNQRKHAKTHEEFLAYLERIGRADQQSECDTHRKAA